MQKRKVFYTNGYFLHNMNLTEICFLYLYFSKKYGKR